MELRRKWDNSTNELITIRDNSLSDREKYEKITGNSSASMTNYDITVFMYCHSRFIRNNLDSLSSTNLSHMLKLMDTRHMTNNYYHIMAGYAGDFAGASNPN